MTTLYSPMTDTPATPSAQHPPSAAIVPSLLHRTLREPLLHFVVLGALVFGADAALQSLRDERKTITVPAAARDEARTVFVSSMGREPTDAESKILVDRWVDNEVLYREGVAMGLDRGDASIRERLIFKALSVTQSGLSLPPVTDAVLRGWFDKHRDKYDEPVRLNFLEAVPGNDSAESTLRALADALNVKAHSDVESSLQVFRGRPRRNLVQSYGEGFTRTLEGGTPGRWMVLKGLSGWHVVQLESMKPAVPANYEEVRDIVKKDWSEQTMSQLTTDTVRAMGKKYRVQQEAQAMVAP